MTWDDPSMNGLIWVSTSADGGENWSPAATTGDSATGIGGVPVVQSNGTVIMPASDDSGERMIAFTSTDGGSIWSSTVLISSISDHFVAGNLRNLALPMSSIDATGLVYVVWPDCRFRAGCSSNDIIISSSSDGITWTQPMQLPIDAISSPVGHFLPAIAVDPSTGGATTHLVLAYHYYPSANCSELTCTLSIAYVTSQDSGATSSAPSVLAGPIALDWLANTKLGRTLGAIAVARPTTAAAFDEPIYTTTNPSIRAQLVQRTHSYHPPRQFYDLEVRYPRKPRH